MGGKKHLFFVVVNNNKKGCFALFFSFLSRKNSLDILLSHFRRVLSGISVACPLPPPAKNVLRLWSFSLLDFSNYRCHYVKRLGLNFKNCLPSSQRVNFASHRNFVHLKE